MDESTSSANDSFYSKETLNTISDQEIETFDSVSNLISAIALFLQQQIDSNDSNSNSRFAKHDIFYSSHIPSISLEDYIKRFNKYIYVECHILLSAAILIDRLCQKTYYILTSNNIHRLLLAAIVLSNKFSNDVVYKNTYYAKIGGVSLNEINYLEYQLYTYLNFELYIKNELYISYEKYLIDYLIIEKNKATQKGKISLFI